MSYKVKWMTRELVDWINNKRYSGASEDQIAEAIVLALSEARVDRLRINAEYDRVSKIREG